MKRLLSIIIISAVFICGCTTEKKSVQSEVGPDNFSYRTGVWVSYSELNEMLNSDFKASFEQLVKNCIDNSITDVFLHVRAFSDAIYPSNLYPLNAAAKNFDGDLLKYIIERLHKSGLFVHAWINPYRVRTADENIEALPSDSPAKQWLLDDDSSNDTNVCFANGIYLNPASEQSRRLVIDGVREILRNYDVDGIHFDDYFYPTSLESFDMVSYNSYCNNCEHPLPLADWRRAQVNQLISGVYTAVKFYNKDIIFSVSPAASLEKNKNELFADVELWMRSGTVDWIIPQLYFGFEYPESGFRFSELIKSWSGIERADNVRLMIGLAAYKINTDSEPDREEWQDNSEILANQAALSREYGADGHIFFSSSSLFSENETNIKSLKALEKERKKLNDKNY